MDKIENIQKEESERVLELLEIIKRKNSEIDSLKEKLKANEKEIDVYKEECGELSSLVERLYEELE